MCALISCMFAHPAPTISVIGLICDIIGAFLVAIEVVNVFTGPTTVSKDDSYKNLGITVANPLYEKHEEKKRKLMKWGLLFLVICFILQIVSALIPVYC